MAFTALPETARQAAIEEGTVTLHDVILAHAVNGPPPGPDARLNQALPDIRTAAELTIAAEWPAVDDEPGLVSQWAIVIAGAVYRYGAGIYPIGNHTGDELARAIEIVGLAENHDPSRAAAAGVIQALKVRGGPHADDPCDPALLA